LLAVLAGSLLLSAWLHLTTRQAVTPPPPRQVAARLRPEAAAMDPAGKTREVRRNLFEYGDAQAKPVGRSIRSAATAAPETPTPAPSVKLVGIVNSGPARRAALSSQGQVVMAAAGEVVDGFTVLSIDGQEGVRLRTPEGAEITLAPPH
jgi:hypothetical protein